MARLFLYVDGVEFPQRSGAVFRMLVLLRHLAVGTGRFRVEIQEKQIRFAQVAEVDWQAVERIVAL